MKLTESINRGFNLLGTSIVALAGFAFTAEIFMESEWIDKADDIGLLVLAVVGIIWYLTRNNRYQRSIMPVVLVVLSLLVKIAAIMIEFKDPDDVGDDFGGLVLFILATILVVYQYRKTKKLLAEAQALAVS